MIDRKLKYVDLYMEYKDLSKIKIKNLTEGFSFRNFNGSEDDIKSWCEIEVSSGDLEDLKSAKEKFQEYYGDDIEKLKERCIFIVDDEKSLLVGTATSWFKLDKENNEVGDFHWLAIRQEYKGEGLSKPLIIKGMNLMRDLGYEKAYLHSQTHTWLAIKVYLDLGWVPFRPKDQNLQEFEEGWSIVNQKISNL